MHRGNPWGTLVAAVLIVVLAPVMLVIAGLLLLFQGRPILFGQTRAGRGGRGFRMTKFRSMREVRDDKGQLLPDDVRTTGIGSFLRRSRLDELPELWNILRGDMAFIGPRPLLVSTILQMGDEGSFRCRVRPGLTGWAQVNGNTLLTLHEKLKLDLWYVDHRSARIDFLILLRTAGVMLRGERINRTQVEKALASRHHRGS
ncbi:MAG TPA: sugar transferase [Sphingobium sp.]